MPWMQGFDDLLEEISLVTFIQTCLFERWRLDDGRPIFYKPFKSFRIVKWHTDWLYEELEKPGRAEIAIDIIPEATKHFSKIIKQQGQLSIAVATGDLEVI